MPPTRQRIRFGYIRISSTRFLTCCRSLAKVLSLSLGLVCFVTLAHNALLDVMVAMMLHHRFMRATHCITFLMMLALNDPLH